MAAEADTRELDLPRLIDFSLENDTVRLKFPGPLEKLFADESAAIRRKRWNAGGAFANAAYLLFLVVDRLLTPDAFRAALVIRLGVVTPIGLILAFVFARNVTPQKAEIMGSSMLLVSSLGKIVILALSDSPLAVFGHFGLPLIIAGFFLVVRLRFKIGLIITSLVVVSYLGCLPLYRIDTPFIEVNNIIFLAVTVLMVLISGYRQEKAERRGYLFTLKERLRATDLSVRNTELDALSRKDPLTGLPNRRCVDQYLKKLFSESPAGCFSVILFDVDHFKAYNDLYGHPAGDACLKRVAECLKASLRRSGDLLARYGGEEFLVILPGTELAMARVVAERARRHVFEADIPHAGSGTDAVVTVSGGVFSQTVSSIAEYHVLVKEADSALYRAKREGRNRIAG